MISPTVRCPAQCDAAVEQVFDLHGSQVWRCSNCGVEILAGNQTLPAERLDRSQFEGALESLRAANYRQVVNTIARYVEWKHCRLLDVGCSNGWFLSLAKAAGSEVFGVEPDAYFYEQAVQRLAPGAHLVRGHFPESLPQDWQAFDVISFHDVFEHLSDPVGVLRAVRQRLSPHGLLVLSLPMSDGFSFRTASLLYRFGMPGGLERMFQVHYPYPHLFYFHARSIQALAQRTGFEALHVGRLRSFSFRGTLNRARMDVAAGLGGKIRQYLNAAVLMTFAMLEPILPADSALVILRRAS